MEDGGGVSSGLRTGLILNSPKPSIVSGIYSSIFPRNFRIIGILTCLFGLISFALNLGTYDFFANYKTGVWWPGFVAALTGVPTIASTFYEPLNR